MQTSRILYRCESVEENFANYQMQESRLTKILGNHFRVYWCKLMLAQEKGLQFYQTRSHAVVLYDTLPAEFIEKVICMKPKEQLYQRASARPRFVLRTNSQCGLQDLPRQEEDHFRKHKAMCRASGNRMQHCGLLSSRHVPHNSSTAE